MRDLINQAIDLTKQAQPNEAILAVLYALLALVNLLVAQATQYWAYLPDLPTVQPVTWDNPTPRVHTNVTITS